jgi:NhaA family Na+:H+ antiporter
VPLGIAAGLLLGNQLGVVAASALAVGLRLAALPAGIRWIDLYGTALLCGIGFTMSLFVASLAFEPGAYQGLERLGILAGSLLSGVAGFTVLRIALPDVAAPAPAAAPSPASLKAGAGDSSDTQK